jgi:hypothetical protein
LLLTAIELARVISPVELPLDEPAAREARDVVGGEMHNASGVARAPGRDAGDDNFF